MWNDKNLRMRRNHTRRFYSFGADLGPGELVRFHEFARTIETPITERISFVEIVGHCDGGYFRQAWLNDDLDQLQPLVGKSVQQH
jgi:hypothetical protein